MTFTARPGVPDTLEEVLSPTWLTAALAPRYPGLQVLHVEPLEVDARVSTNASFRFRCAGQRPAGLPDVLWLKGYFGDARMMASAVGLTEALVYRDLLPGVGLRSLRAVHVEVDDRDGCVALLTADVRDQGATFLDPRGGLDVDQVAQALEQLALLHAATWRAASWAEQPWLAPRIAAVADSGAAAVHTSLTGAVSARVPTAVRDPERLLRAVAAVAEVSAGTADWSVMHGDTHLGNVFLDAAGRPGFLDWQLTQRGAWYVDVGYHIASALPVEDRRRAERDLVDHYVERLVASGAPLPAGDSLQTVRAGMVYGFLLWSMTLRVDPAITAVLLERLGTAVADHDALSLAP